MLGNGWTDPSHKRKSGFSFLLPWDAVDHHQMESGRKSASGNSPIKRQNFLRLWNVFPKASLSPHFALNRSSPVLVISKVHQFQKENSGCRCVKLASAAFSLRKISSPTIFRDITAAYWHLLKITGDLFYFRCEKPFFIQHNNRQESHTQIQSTAEGMERGNSAWTSYTVKPISTKVRQDQILSGSLVWIYQRW